MPILNMIYGATSGGGGWQPGANTIAYWKFDGDLTDEMGNYDLTAYNNNYTYDTLFDGVTQYIKKTQKKTGFTSTLTDTIAFGGNFTLNFYIKFTAVNQVNRIMGPLGNPYYTNIQGEFHSGTSGLQWYNDNETGRTTWSRTPVADTWYNIIITGDGTGYVAYSNGVLLTQTKIGTLGTAGNNLAIGTNISCNDSNGMLGSLSNVIIENKARTAQEVSDYFNQTKSNYGL